MAVDARVRTEDRGGEPKPGRRRGRTAAQVAVLVVAMVATLLPSATAFATEDELAQRRAAHEAAQAAATATPSFKSSGSVTPWNGQQAALNAIVASLAGGNVEVRNASFTGASSAIGSYTGLTTGWGATSNGVILATGNVVDARSPGTFASSDLGRPGDARLSGLVNGSTFDAAVLSFEFRTSAPTVSFDLQFASEEFPEFIGSGFNDVFAFDINGRNCAVTPDGRLISVNTVEFRTAPGLAYGGISQRLTCRRSLATGTWHQARLAIADTGDAIYDSAVLLGGEGLSAGPSSERAPLMFVHGWSLSGGTLSSGSGAATWDDAVDVLKDVTGIDASTDPCVTVVDAGISESGSIRSNASGIINAAYALRSACNTRAPVNIIAHSKGGLDSRLAARRMPTLFGSIVMIATPNAGSRLADLICPNGQCTAGTRDLRTRPMARFNIDTPTPSSVEHWVIGGDAFGQDPIPGERRWLNCRTEARELQADVDRTNGLAALGRAEPITWYAYGVRSADRSDHAVCLNSLFALTTHEWTARLPEGRERGPSERYRHRGIGYYVGLNHGDLVRDRCSLLPAFARVLPASLFDGSTTAGRIAGCTATFRRHSDVPITLAAAEMTPGQQPAEPFELLSGDDPVEEVLLRQQEVDLTGPATVSFPAGTSTVLILHGADELTLSQGGVTLAPDAEEALDTTRLVAYTAPFDGFELGEPFDVAADGGDTAVLVFLGEPQPDEPRLLVGLANDLDGDTLLSVEVDGVDGLEGELTVVDVDGTTALTEAIGPADAPWVLDPAPVVPTGTRLEVVVTLDGPFPRVLSETVDVPDPGVVIDASTATQDDGTELTATFPVAVTETDEYLITIELRDQDGGYVTTAVLDAEVTAGSGPEVFTLDRDDVQRAVADGASELSFHDAVVRRGSELIVVARLPGPFGTLDLDELEEPANAMFGTISGEVVDDRLRFAVPVLRPDGDDTDLLVEGELLDPVLETVGEFALPTEDDGVVVSLTGDTLRSSGPGEYVLSAARLVDRGSGEIVATAPSFAILLDAGDLPPAPGQPDDDGAPPPADDTPQPDLGREPAEPEAPAPDLPTFSDVAGTTHEAGILAIVAAGIASGYPDGTFRPNANVSRGQLATMLAVALQLPPGSAEQLALLDVIGSTHEAGILAVVAAAVASGYPDGTFRPTGEVTRGQLASMLAAGLDLPAAPPGSVELSDIDGSTHAAAIRAVVAAGIARGFGDGTFRPNEPITRGQLATMLAGALGLEPPEPG